MKSEELMIGDWVYNYVANITFKVYPQFFSQWHNKPEQFDATIHPVPITPEILEKNGFDQNGIGGREIELVDADYSDDTYVWQERDEYDNLFTISIYDLNCGSWQMEIVDSPKGKMDVEIKFVHELQHALRFCKIEKEIVL